MYHIDTYVTSLDGGNTAGGYGRQPTTTVQTRSRFGRRPFTRDPFSVGVLSRRSAIPPRGVGGTNVLGAYGLGGNFGALPPKIRAIFIPEGGAAG